MISSRISSIYIKCIKQQSFFAMNTDLTYALIVFLYEKKNIYIYSNILSYNNIPDKRYNFKRFANLFLFIIKLIFSITINYLLYLYHFINMYYISSCFLG